MHGLHTPPDLIQSDWSSNNNILRCCCVLAYAIASSSHQLACVLVQTDLAHAIHRRALTVLAWHCCPLVQLQPDAAELAGAESSSVAAHPEAQLLPHCCQKLPRQLPHPADAAQLLSSVQQASTAHCPAANYFVTTAMHGQQVAQACTSRRCLCSCLL